MPDTDIRSLVEACISNRGQLSEIESAVSAGANINAMSDETCSPLMLAVQERKADIVSALLRLKADPNLPDGKGVSPLHMAIFDGMPDIVQHLIDHSADPNRRDRHGQTPLFFAPHRKACVQLGNARCDVNALNFKGQSALHLAAHAGLNDAVLWLAEHMSKEAINAQDKHGRTAVYCAAHSNLKSTIMLLQEHGADVSLRPHKYSAVKAKRLKEEGKKSEEAERADALNATRGALADAGVGGPSPPEEKSAAPAVESTKDVASAQGAAPPEDPISPQGAVALASLSAVAAEAAAAAPEERREWKADDAAEEPKEKVGRSRTQMSVDTSAGPGASDESGMIEVISPKRKPEELRHLQDEIADADPEVLDVLQTTLTEAAVPDSTAAAPEAAAPEAAAPEAAAPEAAVPEAAVPEAAAQEAEKEARAAEAARAEAATLAALAAEEEAKRVADAAKAQQVAEAAKEAAKIEEEAKAKQAADAAAEAAAAAETAAAAKALADKADADKAAADKAAADKAAAEKAAAEKAAADKAAEDKAAADIAAAAAVAAAEEAAAAKAAAEKADADKATIDKAAAAAAAEKAAADKAAEDKAAADIAAAAAVAAAEEAAAAKAVADKADADKAAADKAAADKAAAEKAAAEKAAAEKAAADKAAEDKAAADTAAAAAAAAAEESSVKAADDVYTSPSAMNKGWISAAPLTAVGPFCAPLVPFTEYYNSNVQQSPGSPQVGFLPKLHAQFPENRSSGFGPDGPPPPPESAAPGTAVGDAIEVALSGAEAAVGAGLAASSVAESAKAPAQGVAAPEPEVKTAMTEPVKAGAKTLQVASQAGFDVGAEVVIDAGTPLEEANEVVGFGSLLLKYPTKFDHPAGATISTPAKPKVVADKADADKAAADKAAEDKAAADQAAAAAAAAAAASAAAVAVAAADESSVKAGKVTAEADAEEMARKKAEEEQEIREQEAAALKIQSIQRGKIAARRVEKKKNAVPVNSEDFHGAAIWQIVLTKHEGKQKYGFSHANARVNFLTEYNKATQPKDNNASSNLSNVIDQDLLAPDECPEALIIKKVAEQGLMEEWNFIHPEAEVKPGDRVIQVNESKSIADMQKELRTTSCTCKILRYPEYFETKLVKRADARKLGFKFEKPANDRLLELKITEISKGGLMDEVNRVHMKSGCHHNVVLPGMRIEAVNEVSGDATLIAQELRKVELDVVALRIRRAAAAEGAKMKVAQKMKMLKAFSPTKKSPFSLSPKSGTAASPASLLSPANQSNSSPAPAAAAGN